MGKKTNLTGNYIKQNSSSYSSQATCYFAQRYLWVYEAAMCKQTGCCCFCLILSGNTSSLQSTCYYIPALTPFLSQFKHQVLWQIKKQIDCTLSPPGSCCCHQVPWQLQKCCLSHGRVLHKVGIAGWKGWCWEGTTWCIPMYSPSKGEKSKREGKMSLSFLVEELK